jgi:lipopolysaccharide export system protein LptA
MKRLILALALSGLASMPLALSRPGHAQNASVKATTEDDKKQPVDIEASEMEIIDADKKAIFRGNVIAKRPKDTIVADTMIVTYIDEKQPDGTTKSAVDVLDCTGNVKITTTGQVVTGNKAIFHVRQDRLDVTGNVVVTQGKTVIRGPHLVADLKTKHTIMKGGRVKGSFVPN